MVVPCGYRSPRNGPRDWKGLLGQEMVPSAGWVIRRKVRGSRRPCAGRKLGTACDRVPRIHSTPDRPRKYIEIFSGIADEGGFSRATALKLLTQSGRLHRQAKIGR
jgi:hypothetical protein